METRVPFFFPSFFWGKPEILWARICVIGVICVSLWGYGEIRVTYTWVRLCVADHAPFPDIASVERAG